MLKLGRIGVVFMNKDKDKKESLNITEEDNVEEQYEFGLNEDQRDKAEEKHGHDMPEDQAVEMADGAENVEYDKNDDQADK